ncbi:MAG: cellulase family glycosylhydrolase [Solirubrobacteraceae bacterium]
MRRGVGLLLVVLAALAWGDAAASATVSGAAVTGWRSAGIVRAAGGPYLTDAAGRRLQLHGVNLVAKCGGGAVDLPELGTPCVGLAQGPRLAYVLSPRAADPGRRFTAADARTLAALGFNVVRLGIIWEGLEPGQAGVGPNDPRYCAPHRIRTRFPRLGAADPYDAAVVAAYLRRTDRIVSVLAGAGLRVILDMHSDAWGSAFSQAAGATPWNGEGAPPWATCTGRRKFVATPGWGSAYADPAVQTAIHHFWANDVAGDLQGQYARVWQAVARHFRADPRILGYELYNEPNDFRVRRFDPELQCDYAGPRRAPVSCAAAGHPAALAGGLIGAVQSADRTHVVIYEPSGAVDYGAADTLGIAEPLPLGNLALAFHAYGGIAAQLRQARAERARTRVASPGGPALILDEFGATGDAPSMAGTVDLAEPLNLSWVYWSAMQLNDPTGGAATEGLIDQSTRRPYPALARALAVPYPWATAGRPGAQSFDRRTGVFRYRYATDPAVRAPTEIELPRSVYRPGYTVRVAGAEVVSARGAHVLALRAGRRARRVALTVSPGP